MTTRTAPPWARRLFGLAFVLYAAPQLDAAAIVLLVAYGLTCCVPDRGSDD